MENNKVYKVLLIEDSDKDRQLIESMLKEDEEFKYEVTWADRLASGLSQLSTNSFNLVLLDLFLPETKGLRTLEKVFERSPHLAAVVLTQLDDENSGLQAVRHGAQEYLVKGHFDSYSLRRAIRHAIERSLIEIALRKSEKSHRELIAKLQLANRELESFSYSVSHDLRAPLRAITGFSEILNRRFRGELPENALKYLDNIIKAGNQMGELIDDLLTYSRLGKGSVNYEEVNLSELFEGITVSLARQISRTKAQVTIQTDMPTIVSNKSLLQQIFLNLINNALMFVRTDSVPCIEISCTVEADSLVISVADHGIGIPKSQLDRIFNVFQRLHSQELYSGTGIGLSIVQKAAEILHGKVSVQSELDKGSVFSVHLPYKRS